MVKRDLKERTKAFSLRVIRLLSTLPDQPCPRILGHQVLRSATSIGANYREASRARSKAEFVAKTGDCLKEADETEYWLELIEACGLVGREEAAGLLDEARPLIAIFTTINRKAKT